MRLHGIDRDAFDRYSSATPSWAYDVVAPGFKYNMPDVAAAMGRVQLQRIEARRWRRQTIADFYLSELADTPLALPATAPEGQVHSWHLFVVRLPAGGSRDAFIADMAAAGIGTSVHFMNTVTGVRSHRIRRRRSPTQLVWLGGRSVCRSPAVVQTVIRQ